MFNINNQPYINLTPFIDYDSLIALKPFFVKAIVESTEYCKPTRFRTEALYDSNKVGLVNAIEYFSAHPELFPSEEFLRELINKDQLANYLCFQEKVHYGAMAINLKYAIGWEGWLNRDDPTKTAKTPAYNNFKFLFNWIEQQNIFVEPGRTVIYINETNMEPVEHFDLPESVETSTQFIWINLDRRKNIYVRDKVTKEKVSSNDPVIIFDDRNFHGTETSEYATWSLRIDGYFTDEFLEKTGLVNHFGKSKISK